MRLITGSAHASIVYALIFLYVFKFLLTMNYREKESAEEERRRSGGCIVRESKGGVIRPNGSQMAGCQ